ncbi:MAG: NPCBM/NEW2 domain-containing protein, partial [Kiritimatiellae bacterium]|nr:NPCBM/NEW2 domain-containing protein [Kiritimatiellia bacterium]
MKVIGKTQVLALMAAMFLPALSAEQKVYLETLELSNVLTGYGEVRAGRSCDNHPLAIGGKTFVKGVGLHAQSQMDIALDGRAVKFVAQVGVDDEEPPNRQFGTVRFHVYADGKRVASTPVIRRGDAARSFDVPLAGVKLLSLRVDDGGDG